MWFGDPIGHIMTVLWYSEKHLTDSKSLQGDSFSKRWEKYPANCTCTSSVIIPYCLTQNFPAALGKKKAKYLALTNCGYLAGYIERAYAYRIVSSSLKCEIHLPEPSHPTAGLVNQKSWHLGQPSWIALLLMERVSNAVPSHPSISKWNMLWAASIPVTTDNKRSLEWSAESEIS